MRTRLLTTFAAAALLSGCTLGPNYRRPAVQVPDSFRAPAPLPPPQAESLADLKWWDVFKDQELQNLIRTAKGAGGGSFVTLPTVDHVSEFLTANIALLNESQDVGLQPKVYPASAARPQRTMACGR